MSCLDSTPLRPPTLHLPTNMPHFPSSTSEYPYPLPSSHSHHDPHPYFSGSHPRTQGLHHSRLFQSAYHKTTYPLPLRPRGMDFDPEIYSTAPSSFDGSHQHHQYQPGRLQSENRFGPTVEHYSCIYPPLRQPIPETIGRYRARPGSALPGMPRQWIETRPHGQERLVRGSRLPGRPNSPSDRHPCGSSDYVLSGALSPQEKIFYEGAGRIDPVAGTGINSPEIMVEHPEPHPDWFGGVDIFNNENREQPTPIPASPERLTQPHLDPDVHHPLGNESKGHPSFEHGCLSTIWPPSSFFHPRCQLQPQPSAPISPSCASIEEIASQSTPEHHVRFATPPHGSYSPDPIREHDIHGLEDLLSLIQNALRKLRHRRLLIRRHSNILQRQMERTRYERSKLRAERRRWIEWLEKIREEEYYHSRVRDFDQRAETKNRRGWGEQESHAGRWRSKHDYYDENGANVYSSPGMDDESRLHHHFFSSPLFSVPPPPSNTPDSQRSPILNPTSIPPQLPSQLMTQYETAWSRTPITAPSSALPWPSPDLSASAVDRPTRDIELALEIQEDLSKQREWNVFCFFALAFGLSPQWVKDGGQNLRFELAGWHNKDVDLVGLKKQVRIEKVRWHPDKLGKRNMSSEDMERAKSVWVAVGRVGEEVEKLEGGGMFGLR